MKQLRLSQVYGNNVCVGLLSKHRAATFSHGERCRFRPFVWYEGSRRRRGGRPLEREEEPLRRRRSTRMERSAPARATHVPCERYTDLRKQHARKRRAGDERSGPPCVINTGYRCSRCFINLCTAG